MSSLISPQLVADGADGAIIVWQDTRNSATSGTDIFARASSAEGTH